VKWVAYISIFSFEIVQGMIAIKTLGAKEIK